MLMCGNGVPVDLCRSCVESFNIWTDGYVLLSIRQWHCLWDYNASDGARDAHCDVLLRLVLNLVSRVTPYTWFWPVCESHPCYEGDLERLMHGLL